MINIKNNIIGNIICMIPYTGLVDITKKNNIVNKTECFLLQKVSFFIKRYIKPNINGNNDISEKPGDDAPPKITAGEIDIIAANRAA